jgi:glycosyltransferase involved in cell wall biosynthesis
VTRGPIPGRLRILICHESDGAAQHQQRAVTPATGLRQLGHKVHTSSYSFHGDVITGPSVDDVRVLELLKKGSQVPAILPPPDVVILRLLDQAEPESIEKARESGQLVFCDLDDDVWHLPEWSNARAFLRRSGEWVHAELEEAREVELERKGRNVRSVDLDCLEANIAAATGTICSTPAVARAVEEAVPGARTWVCQNGIDSTLYTWPRKPVEHEPLRVAWMGTTGDRVVGFLDVLPAVAHVLSEYGCEFWHLGAEEGAPSIREWLPPDWSVPVRVVPWARSKVLPWLLSEIDVGIIARRPHPFTEAQSTVSGLRYGAAGVPYIASASELYTELDAQGCGVVYDHPDGAGQALTRIVSDAYLRDELRIAGRAVALRYSPRHIAESYVRAFEEARAAPTY